MRTKLSYAVASLFALALVPASAFAQTVTPGVAASPTAGGVTVGVIVDLDANDNKAVKPEGLIADVRGLLYTSDTATGKLYQYRPSTGELKVMGTLPSPALGMAFDPAGNLYLASGSNILQIGNSLVVDGQFDTANVTTFATGVTGANGLIFDPQGRLYVSGAATGNIYVVATNGITSTFATGFKSNRTDQPISTNGLAMSADGKTLYSDNTGSGQIDKIVINADGSAGPVQHWVTDPLLLGADGNAFASNGDLYVAANERNAVVKVTPDGKVSDVTSNGNTGPLEFPASLAFSGDNLYASNFDQAKGTNNPSDPGVGGSIVKIALGVSSQQPAPSGPPASGTGTPTALVPPTSATTPIATASQAPVQSTPILPPTDAESIDTAVPVTATPVVVIAPPPVAPIPSPVTTGMPSTGGGNTALPFAPLLLALGSIVALAGVLVRRGKHS